MKKLVSKIYLLFIIVLYGVFCYIYATDGLKIQLANKIQKNIYDYVKYEYNPISTQLYMVGIIGMLITGLVFIFGSMYKMHKYIKKCTEKRLLQIIAILAFFVIIILFLHICRNYFVIANMPIGEEM